MGIRSELIHDGTTCVRCSLPLSGGNLRRRWELRHIDGCLHDCLTAQVRCICGEQHEQIYMAWPVGTISQQQRSFRAAPAIGW